LGNVQRYFTNFNASQQQLTMINKLKQDLQDNSEKIKKNVDEYGKLYKEMFDKIQNLNSKLEDLTTMQSKCSEIYPQINNNVDDEKTESLGESANLLFNDAKNNVEQGISSVTSKFNEGLSDARNKFNEGLSDVADSVANNVPFSNSSKLQKKIDELEEEIKTLNSQISQLKTDNNEEKNILAESIKTPISEIELDNLDNETIPSTMKRKDAEGIEGAEGAEGVEGAEGIEGAEGAEGAEGVEGEEGEFPLRPPTTEELIKDKQSQEQTNNYLLNTKSELEEIPESKSVVQQGGKKRYKSKKRRNQHIKKSRNKKNMERRFYL
jgi:chaperonin cofactor prefoldin